VFCPNETCLKAKNVVYRTIDLNNPFPSKNGEGSVTGYSNGGTGRLPSSNWQYEQVVSDEILNARGVSGNELYNLKPLYTITLTPDTMKMIREYNKNNQYADFKLDCKTYNKSAACVSTFVHTTLYSAIDRNNSVANCYNMQNSEAGFIACYEKDNK
jgi:hypothetical protein